MNATKINLTYNPYTVETEIAVNGEVVNDGLVEICKNMRLQQWIDKIFPKIAESFNTKNIEFIFKGTVLDAEDVKDAVKKFNGIILKGILDVAPSLSLHCTEKFE